MVRKTSLIALVLVALFAVSLLAPMTAFASQSTKNTWRNLGIGSAGVAGYGLLTHNTGLAVLGVAGAAYSASRYEHDRHSQSYHRTHRYYYHHRSNRH
jgi:O-antigen ligase